MRVAALVLGALTLGLAAPAAAQLQSTGNGGALGSDDTNWSVSWTGVCNDSWTAPAPVGGSSPYQCGATSGAGAAQIVNDVSNVWQTQNDAVAPRWISAWDSSNGTCVNASGGPVTCDSANPFAAHFQYSYSTAFMSSGAGFVYFQLGWDNILTGFNVNGSNVALGDALVSSLSYPFTDRYGFCRDGDGMFASSAWASGNCTATFKIAVNAGNNTFAINTLGDGATDGLFLFAEDGGQPTEVVPEPATMTLLATGLAGMAAARRRRNAPKA